MGGRVQIVAEMGANHGQQLGKALAMVRAAQAVGADAVKIQLFTPEQMTLDSSAERFRIPDGLWAGRTLYELYRQAYLPHEWTPEIKALADSLGLKLIASVYHPDMVAVAENYGIETYKIASFDVFYADLLKSVGQTGKPVIVSCGTCNEPDIAAAVDLLGMKDISLLKCTSAYPAPPASMNLRTIPDMRARFGRPVGLSDHTVGHVCAVCAVALGATIIEKHFKLDEEGLDAAFSASPEDFRAMVNAVRQAEEALGTVDYAPTTDRYIRKKVGDKWVRTVS